MREQLRTKIMQLQQDMVSKNNDTKAPAIKDGSEKVANTAPEKEPDMTQQDLMFCEKALEESNIIEAKSNQDELVLSDILNKKEEKSYSVIVDIALKPLPSERNKNNNKENNNQDKDHNNKNDNSKGINDTNPSPSGAVSVSKPTLEELKAMRNGVPLQQHRENQHSVVSGKQQNNTKEISENANHGKVSRKEGLRNLRMGRSYGDSNETTQTRQTTLDRPQIPVNRSY